MAIDPLITLTNERPIEPHGSPYNQCGMCHYVGVDVQTRRHCPACSAYLTALMRWPEPQLQELWREEVFCWNAERSELAAIVAAMYFEASEYNLLYYGIRWLHPTLNSVGADPVEFRKREAMIQQHLDTLDNRQKMNDEFAELFGADGKVMLETVLGADAALLWINYLNGRR